MCVIYHGHLPLNEKASIPPSVLTVHGVTLWRLTIRGIHQRILTAREIKWKMG